MDQKRLFLAIAVSLAILLGFQLLMRRHDGNTVEHGKIRRTDDQEAADQRDDRRDKDDRLVGSGMRIQFRLVRIVDEFEQAFHGGNIGLLTPISSPVYGGGAERSEAEGGGSDNPPSVMLRMTPPPQAGEESKEQR